MTNPEFAGALSERINLQLDLPWLNEAQEGAAIRWCIDQVAHLIPDSIKSFILDASDGLSSEELKRLEDTLVAYLNEKIDIPWMPESVEEQLLRPIVQAILDLAKQGMSALIPDHV
ncbi:MAG: hypothetical protein GY826_31300 [Fuerstiella sp.]|nr:hypothetical protein [Fuerstiella sp.]